ncbi:MAG: peptidase family protein [Nocardioidaceae bacterium]|jgi:Zn-dependent metalloprotease|nr:peptidase family protein [Nocardioidaceae bacterium]
MVTTPNAATTSRRAGAGGKAVTRSSVACIVPPFVLDDFARNGDSDQRAAALEALALDMSLRDRRSTAAAVRFASGAVDNRLLVEQLGSPGQPHRLIYDIANATSGSATLVRAEGQDPVGDDAANEAYDGLGDTYTLFWDVFQRDSIDDHGMDLRAIVHYGVGYDNAFWNGEQMVFGDGRLFKRFTLSLDVIGHELQHGVTEHESGLLYQDQSGALNESLSDVFGSLVKQYKLRQPVSEADWLIGADIVGPTFPGRALRDMADPGTAWERDPQPGHMDDFVVTMDDHGGVHINSGIPNKAFHTLAMSLDGYAWTDAGTIWYEALRHYRLQPESTFRAFARLTTVVARRQFGRQSTQATAVQDAWRAVGVSRADS